jgi:hypothetical protein
VDSEMQINLKYTNNCIQAQAKLSFMTITVKAFPQLRNRFLDFLFQLVPPFFSLN